MIISPWHDFLCTITLLGSHEDDIHMAENVKGLKTALSIGFLEMTDDILQRLPTFLSTYDAVVVTDSSFQYIQSVVDELLQVKYIIYGWI